jgi:hypothetical protein
MGMIALKGLGKAFLNATKSVKPTLGKSKTKEYLKENQRKLSQAKIVKSQMKVEKDIETGYKSVKKKGDE